MYLFLHNLKYLTVQVASPVASPSLYVQQIPKYFSYSLRERDKIYCDCSWCNHIEKFWDNNINPLEAAKRENIWRLTSESSQKFTTSFSHDADTVLHMKIHGRKKY